MELSNIGSPAKIVHSSLYVINDSESGEVVLAFDSIDECNFTASANVTKYPTEYGINATDYKYLNPSVIEAIGVINRNSYIGKNASQSTLAKAQTIEKVRAELEHYISGIYKLDVQTKAALRKGYTLSKYEIPETIDNYSLFEVNMTFEQVVTFDNANPTFSADSDTVSAGVSQVTQVGETNE